MTVEDYVDATPAGDTTSDMSATPPPPTLDVGEDVPALLPVDVPPDILFLIIGHSPFATLLRWRRTSRACYTAVAIELRGRYERCVHPFVDDVLAFDHALRRYGVIVSGSVALQYFVQPTDWVPTDLDLYVPDHTFDDFVTALTTTPGIDFTPTDTPTVNRNCSTTARRGLLKCLRRFQTPSGRSVDVIRSPRRTPVIPLLGFWSTLVMNFLTPDGAACGYPDSTLDLVAFVRAGPLPGRARQAVVKYEGRGFVVLQDSWWPGENGVTVRTFRYFGEPDAVVVDFRLNVNHPQPQFPITPTSTGWYICRIYPPGASVPALPIVTRAEHATQVAGTSSHQEPGVQPQLSTTA